MGITQKVGKKEMASLGDVIGTDKGFLNFGGRVLAKAQGSANRAVDSDNSVSGDGDDAEGDDEEEEEEEEQQEEDEYEDDDEPEAPPAKKRALKVASPSKIISPGKSTAPRRIRGKMPDGSSLGLLVFPYVKLMASSPLRANSAK